MKRLVPLLLFFVFAAALLLFPVSETVHESHAQDPDKPSFEEWLKGVKKEASRWGVSRETLDKALEGLSPIERIIELDRAQPEFRLSLDEYLRRLVNRDKIKTGRAKFRRNRKLLQIIRSKYGVQPRFLVALWGVETSFGRRPGNFPVIASLATLAYDGRRGAYFRKELIGALTILDKGHIALEEFKGSWAGAMGQLQFMPSTFLRHAVDFDKDGKANIWHDKGDAFASAANYLSKSGWRVDQTWGRQVSLPESLDRNLIGLATRKRLSRWQMLGVRRADGTDLPTADLVSSVIQPEGQGSRAFVVYKNYRCLLRWNRSHNFALAAAILSDRIARR